MTYAFRKKTLTVSVLALALLAVAWLWIGIRYSTGAQEAENDKFQKYPLNHETAAEVAPRLRNLLSEVVGPVDVGVDDKANALLIRGNDDTHRIAVKLLETLDRPPSRPMPAGLNLPPREELSVKGYRVADDELDSVAQRLRSQFATEPGVRIVADPRTKQVVVVAPQRAQDRIAIQIAALARAPDASVPAAPKIPAANFAADSAYLLRHISAGDLEQGLKRIWGTSVAFFADQNRDLVTAKLPSSQPEPALVQIDRRRSQVTFSGSAEARREWQQLLKTLDHKRLSAEADSQVVPVNRADPEQLRRALNVVQTSFGGNDGNKVSATVPARASARPLRNAEFVAQNQAAPNNAQPNPPPAARDPFADNEKKPPANPPGADEKKPGAMEDGEDDETGLIGNVQIEFLEGLDVIIVRGKKKDVERVTKIINDIERLSTETRPMIEVLPLTYVNSQAVTEVVVQVYDQILSARQGRVSITALVKPNAILLIGRQESIAVVIELIKKLDHPVAPESLWQVFPLKHTSVAEAEQTVSRLYGVLPAVGAGGAQLQQGGGAGPGGGAQGGAAAGGGFQGQGGQGGSVGTTASLKPRLIVVSDFRSNSLVVQGSPRDLDDVATLIQQIDVEANTAMTELRIFKLQNTIAAELGPVLQAALKGQVAAARGAQPGGGGIQGGGGFGGGGAAGNNVGANAQNQYRSTNLQFVTIDPQGNRVIAAGIPADIVVNADVTANSLVVRAPAKSMELIGALIKELDSLPDAQSQIKVFTVVNGDATNLAAMLQQLFGQQVTIGRGTGGLFGGGGGGAALNIAPQGGANAGESSLVPLRFAVDVRSNSIMASGSTGDLAVVETLLLRLDEGDVPSRKITVYRLKNAFAQDVASAITTFLQNQRQVIQQNQLFNQAIGPFEQLEREMIVAAEAQTNSVIVSATPKFYDDIMRIIKTLDYRPPMVMVQVLIAQVNLNDIYEFGVQLGLQNSLLFDRGKAGLPTGSGVSNPGGGFNFNNTPLNPLLPNANSLNQNTLAGQALSNLGVGTVSQVNGVGYGGLVLSAASDSVNILLRALQDVNRVQILARPQVMCVHNRQAQVQVGSLVPRLQGTTVTNAGTTQNIADTQTGLILNIIPQINDDGIVVLNLQATNSQLNLSTPALSIPVSTGGGTSGTANLFPINQTTAVTTISARDGQTVVFAGLISTTKQLIKHRVPYLSDIPFLGNLFQYEQNQNLRSELLIIMTPHIIKYDDDYDWLKESESERMNWCLGDVVNTHGNVGLRGNNCLFCPSHIPAVYPDQDPTGAFRKADQKSEDISKPNMSPTDYRIKSQPELNRAARQNAIQPKYIEQGNASGENPQAMVPNGSAYSMANASSNANPVGNIPSTNVGSFDYGSTGSSTMKVNTASGNANTANSAGVDPRAISRPVYSPPPSPQSQPRSTIVEPATEPLSSARSANRYPNVPAAYYDPRDGNYNRLPPSP